MPEFLTVKEAAQLVGKSPSSIRRIIYPILQDNQHLDRHHVQPSPEDALQLRLKGENFAWKLSEELLRREVPMDDQAEKTNVAKAASQRHSSQGDSELLSMLRRELEIKNVQITQQAELIGRQMELISGLSERLREGNVLIGALQQRLAMPAQRPSPSAPATEVKPTAKSTSAQQKPKQAPKQPRLKRGIWQRLFR